jgi:hypothetical protein
MAANETANRRLGGWECPNPKGQYSLAGLVGLIKSDKTFAQFFFTQLKNALNNDKGAIACVDSYLAPTTQELEDLGIPTTKVESMRRCTDSGLLVLVITKDSA